jgi:hypothetical protein
MGDLLVAKIEGIKVKFKSDKLILKTINHLESNKQRWNPKRRNYFDPIRSFFRHKIPYQDFTNS